MLTTQEMLNDVFTSGKITTSTMIDATNMLINDVPDRVIQWNDEMIELVFNAGMVLINTIKVDPEKAKTLINDAADKMMTNNIGPNAMDDKSIQLLQATTTYLIHEIDENPQMAREFIGGIIVALDGWYSKLSENK